MSLIRRLLNLTRRDAVTSEIDREIDFHIDEIVDDLRASGISEREARLEARRRFGNRGMQRERARDADLVPAVEAMGQDLRYAARTLRMNPGFSAVVILSVALGIGANVAVFSILDELMLRPLPVVHPEQLAQVTHEGGSGAFSNPVWEQIRDGSKAFSGAFAVGNAGFSLPGGGEERPVSGHWVSGGFFATLGVTAAAGRLIANSDDFRGCPAVVVLSHGYWRSEFGGDPGIVGRTITLSDKPFQVIGVSEARFRGITIGFPRQVYVPLCQSNGLRNARFNFLRVGGRLREGTTIGNAAGTLTQSSPAIYAATVPTTLSAREREAYLGNRLSAASMQRGISGLRDEFGKPVAILMAVAGLVLLVTCANIANLLLARATARERELTIRLAVGAARGRVLRQLLTESLLLSFSGAAIGAVVAVWGSRALTAVMSSAIPGASLALGANLRVLAFALVVAVVTGLAFGLAPAWRVLGLDLLLPLNGSRALTGRRAQRAPKALVVVQMTVSMVLVVGAMLFVQTFRRLVNTDPGFDPRNVLIVDLDLSRSVADSNARPAVANIRRQIGHLPGVVSASLTNITPLSGSSNTYEIMPRGSLDTRGIKTYVNRVGPDYLRTIGAPLLQGRAIDDRDVAGAQRVAVIGEQAARRFFGSTAAIGKQFRMSADQKEPLVEVIGVIKDAKQLSLREEPLPMILIPEAQERAHPYPTFVVRYSGPESDLRRRITAVLQQTSPATTVRYRSMKDELDASIASERVLAFLSGFFGAIGLLVAVIGLYGLMSYAVTVRQKEIGIRMALGARREQVLGSVLREAALLTGVGAIVGIVIAILASRFVASLLFGVSARDIGSLTSSVLLLAAVAGLASLVPALRASRLNPLVALREQ